MNQGLREEFESLFLRKRNRLRNQSVFFLFGNVESLLSKMDE